MSLPAPYQEHYYVADGVTTSFSFGEYFTAPASANVKCIVYFEDGTSSVPTFTADIVTGYINITALTTPDGQVLNAPPAGSSVRVFRDTPEQQNVTASQLQNYTAKQLEKIFDSIVAMIQENTYTTEHKTLRLTETQRDVFLAFLKESNDDALLYWDNEARTIVPTDFVHQDVVRMAGGLFFRAKNDSQLRPYLEWSRNGQTDWNSLNLRAPIDTANEAKEIAQEAKEIAQNAKDVADDAKDVADEAKQIAEGIDGKAQQALDNSVEALETAEEAKEMIQNQIIVRSATIPTASADLVGKAYQYAGTTNGVYTHNYIYECQEIETNSYGWVRADVQPNHEAQILALQADVSDIEALIPAQATPQNQLGDKAFINSSIATNTANFIGTFNSVAELEAYSGTVTNNDYAFVIGADSAGNTTYNRYKYNANTQQWIYEYTLNNSSFTADQWTAINSGVTASDVSKARTAVQPSDVGNGTITITQGGTTKGSFTTNQGNNTTIDLDAGSAGQYPLNEKNISNCITEIPQDIKLELSNGTLTLKAGSKVYVPNGAGVFNEVVIQNDIVSSTGTSDTSCFLFYNNSNGYLNIVAESSCYSGNTEPTTTPYVWYNITNNIITRNTGSSTFNYSLPLAKITCNSSSQIVGIDQVFNGFGYIGSTLFVLPGVQCLSPAGRNLDGTLRNIVLETAAVWKINWVINGAIEIALRKTDSTTVALNIGRNQYSYNEHENLLYFNGQQTSYPDCIVGFGQVESGRIASLTPKTTFHAVDYNEADFVIAFQRPTAANNYTWYRKYKSGWVEQGGTYGGSQNQTISLPVEMADNKYSLMLSFSTTSGNAPVYSSYAYRDKTTTSFVAINSGSINGDWQVSGMSAS